MILTHNPYVFNRALTDPEEVTSATLLGVCASMKPTLERTTRSAVRSLLSYALNKVNAVYPDVWLLDLRNHPLPLFDGRMPDELDEPSVSLAFSCVQRAGGLLLAIPAYWSGVAGVFKNFVDVLCGPAYDLDKNARTIFAGKPVGLLVVGADEESTRLGTRHAEQILVSTGAQIVGAPVLMTNPRAAASEFDTAQLTRGLIALTAELARHICAIKEAGS